MSKRCLTGLVVLAVLVAAVVVSRPAETAAPPPRRPEKYPSAKAHSPTPLPDRLILTWKADPATSQAVTWRTSILVKKAFAEVAVAEDGPDFAGYRPKQRSKARRVDATTTELQTDLRSEEHTSELQ